MKKLGVKNKKTIVATNKEELSKKNNLLGEKYTLPLICFWMNIHPTHSQHVYTLKFENFAKICSCKTYKGKFVSIIPAKKEENAFSRNKNRMIQMSIT